MKLILRFFTQFFSSLIKKKDKNPNLDQNVNLAYHMLAIDRTYSMLSFV